MSQFIARFGYKVRTSGTKTDISKSINHLLDDIHGKKEENLIETVSIRAMQKARYSTHNIGHYGLAFDYYTHFTSPIRRFPDMMVHRLVTKYMDGGRSVSETKYEDLCDHSSNMEQIAANAERASIKYKQVEFMSERLGHAAKDRHENLGFGQIGFDALNYIVHHPDFENVPKILETPYIPSATKAKKSYAPYKYEIQMLREQVFNPHMKEQILADAEN